MRFLEVRSKRRRWSTFLSAAVGLAFGLTMQAAEDRDTKVRNDKSKVEAGGEWIYNDFQQALDQGRRAGKPILVTLRCIP